MTMFIRLLAVCDRMSEGMLGVLHHGCSQKHGRTLLYTFRIKPVHQVGTPLHRSGFIHFVYIVTAARMCDWTMAVWGRGFVKRQFSFPVSVSAAPVTH